MPNTIEATLTGSTGPAFVERNGERIALHEGDAIYEADLIITGPETTIDISFRDGTKSRIAPDSEMRLVDFEFGPSEDPSFIVNLTQGAMRTVSGDIVKLNPEAFEVVTPRATVGIRGTEFITQVGEESDTHVVLYIKDGHIMMVTGQDGSSVTFDRPLQMTTVDGSGGALHAQEYSLDQMQDLMNALAPSFGNNIPRSEAEQGNFPHLTRKSAEQEEQEETEQEEKEKDKSESSNESDAPVTAEGQESSESAESAENSEQAQASSSSSSSSADKDMEATLADSNAVDIVYDNEEDLDTVLTALKEAGIQVNSVQVASASTQTDADTDSVTDNLLETEQAGANDNSVDTGGDLSPPDISEVYDNFSENLVTGAGNDTVTITGAMQSGSIDTGAGVDAITINNMTSGSIDTGDGADSIIIGTMSSGSINAGDGADFIKIDTASAGTTINGGDGTDILLTNSTSLTTNGIEIILSGTGIDNITSIEDLASYGIRYDDDLFLILNGAWTEDIFSKQYTSPDGTLTITAVDAFHSVAIG